MPLTIAEIMARLPTAFLSDEAQGVNAALHFKFIGVEAGEWNAAIGGGKCEVGQGIPRSRPSITVAADSADFIRVVSGELDGMQAVMDGRLKITGDTLLALRLIKLFRVP